jgi:hypothetical protein
MEKALEESARVDELAADGDNDGAGDLAPDYRRRRAASDTTPPGPVH